MQSPESASSPDARGGSEEFPPIDRATWRERVERELGGADFSKELETPTEDGSTIRPLYGPEDEASDPGPHRVLPGVAPRSPRSVRRPRVASRLHGSDAENLSARILEEVEGGALAIDWPLELEARLGLAGPGGSRPADGPPLPDASSLGALFHSEKTRDVTWLFRSGGNGYALAARVLSALDSVESSEPRRVCLGADPFGAYLLDGSLPTTPVRVLAELAEWLPRVLPHTPHLLALTLGLDAVHDAGGTAALELGWGLAAWAEIARALGSTEITLEQLATTVGFRVSMGLDVLEAIAKLRALRGLVARFHGACGLSSEGADAVPPPPIHAVGSARVLADFDPKTNLLRSTTEAFAALCGGADYIGASPFVGPDSKDGQLARRMARNTPLVLIEEGSLDRVADPAAGSYALEQRTLDLEAAGWERFQSIEAEGGLLAWIEAGHLDRELDRANEGRAERVARRQRPLVGVSVFPRPEEPSAEPVDSLPTAPAPPPDAPNRTSSPCEDFDQALDRAAQGAPWTDLAPQRPEPPCRTPRGPRRDASPFEELRREVLSRTPRPSVFLACLGPLARHNARAQFASDAFTVGGFRVRQGSGTSSDADSAGVAAGLVEAWRVDPTSHVCICGDDPSLVEGVVEVARAFAEVASQEGPPGVVVAGRPREADPEAWHAAGVAEVLVAGCDLLGFLRARLAPESGSPSASTEPTRDAQGARR